MKSIVVVTVSALLIAAGLILGGQAPGVPVAIERVVTHVATDKPMYRTGERLYVRGVVLRAGPHSPLTTSPGSTGNASFEIKGPKGDTVASGLAAIVDSVAGFSWDIPASQAGGEYTVRVSHPYGETPGERKFDIRAYRVPRLKSQIVFVRDGYGPGDTVAANLHVERAEGGIPAGAKVTVSARIDGEEIWRGTTAVDRSGSASASFKLPAAIMRGEGVIAMVIEDGGAIETASKTIPILLQTLDLAIYPEGGDLIAGLPNRVYVEGRTPAHKPADMTGVVVNAAGKEVAKFRTEHEGRGRFWFTPAKGDVYSIRVTDPAGIKASFALSAVKDSGVVLSSTSDIIRKEEDVDVRIASTVDGVYSIALTQRGQEFAFKRMTLQANRPADVAFTVPKSLDGVIVATVYDDRKNPMAERLLFRQPDRNVNVKIVADRTDYVPGDKVTLRISTTDESGKPVAAIVGLTVADSSVLEMIEKREQAPRLPVMVLLETEVKDLADAHVYLDAANPKAPLATDLLLGTQGWRRFLTAGTGLLTGVVMDATKAVIPGVELRAVNTITGSVLTAITNESGLYVFPNVKAGTYRVTASLPGFQTKMIPALRLAGNTSVKQDMQLDVGAVKMMAEVAVAAEMAVFKNAVANLPVVAQRVQEAPRAFDELLELAPARQAALGGVFRDGRADFARKEANVKVVTVREYAHTRRPDWTEASRVDFTETVYWNAGVKTNAATGLASVSFDLSDSVTSFRVLADAFGQDGALGSSIGHVESVKPFSIEPKIPLQVTSGDVIELPIGVVNGMNQELRGWDLSLKGDGMRVTILGQSLTSLGPKQRTRRFAQLDIGPEFTGRANLTLDARAGAYRDSVTRPLDVQPLGFPREISTGGVLEKNASRSFEFLLPGEVVRGSVSSTVTVYPTPLASMTDALQSLLREPNGCFEQTSSTSYPMVMAQQYFLSHTGVDAAIIEKTRNLLEDSYKKLTGFESHSKGYEWFGADPGHEALTAYGVMQFTDMSRVRAVDKDMLARTRAWLLARRDGNGGFNRSSKAIDSFGGAPAETTNAYIVWALVESGENGLAREIAAVKSSANSTSDSYVVALAANILHATGDSAGARALLDKLAKNQDNAGHVKGAVTSITRSGGDALAIETTALSVLAWMREPAYAANVEKALKWIVEANKSGRFGSTQSTILALRAIVAYDSAHARAKAPGRIVLTVDGRAIGTPLAFTADTKGALVLPEFARELAPGKHVVALRMEDGSSMPFSIAVKYHSVLPESSEQTQLGIRVALRDSQVQEGGITEAGVSIVNKSDKVIPTPVAIVGIPGGLEVRHDQLKELVRSGKIDAYEVIGRDVVLYWRYLKANDKLDLALSLVAAVPGSYTGPASRAYLYYTDEYKSWAPGLKVTVTRR